MITLVKDTIDKHDIDRLINWLKTYPRLTKGEYNLKFEEDMSEEQSQLLFSFTDEPALVEPYFFI